MKKSLPLIFFLGISLLLIIIWFKAGFIYGGGDVGLQTYNPQRTLENARYIWWGAIAPGTPIPQGLTAVPFHFIFSKFQLIGFTPLYIQATLFFLCLFFMGYGMYRLLLQIFGYENKSYPILGGLFYMFNPYMMINVWHRFIHSTFFLAAALPFLVIFWINWIRKGKSIWLLLFLIVNLLSAYLYGTIAYILTIWILLFLITVTEAFFPWLGVRNFGKISSKFVIGFIFWILTNIWWILPVFSVGPAVFSKQHSSEESLTSLINISKQTIIPYSLQMINPFYLFYQAELGESYKNFFVRLIPWLFVVIILVGLVGNLKKKGLVSWSIIFFIVFFLAKGAASPFGFPYIFGFEHFFSFGVLRNPFEKIGILLPFISSILLISGLQLLKEYLSKFLKIIHINLLIAVFFLLILGFNWSMILRPPFGKPDNPGFVKIPDTYLEANNWINKDNKLNKDVGKILHLPLILGESVSYKWEYGYNGLESSDLLFSLPSLSHIFNLKRVDDSLTGLYRSFNQFKDQPEKILRLLQDFNVRYIVLHKDVNWLGGNLFDPSQTEQALNNLYFLKHTKDFGDLKIYKLDDQYFKSKIYLAANFQLIYPSDNSLTWPYILGNSGNIITPVNSNLDTNILKLATNQIIFPEDSFIYPKKTFVINVVNQLAASDVTLNLLLAQFTKIKPVLTQNGEIQSTELNDKLISLTEKIAKILRLQNSGHGFSKSLIEDYQQNLNNILSTNFRDSRLLLYINESDISLLFQVHLTAMEALKETAVSDTLKNWMVKNNFIPQNQLDIDNKQMIDRQKIFKFQIPTDGKYEILMTNTVGREIFPDSLEKINLSVNGKPENLIGKDKGEFLSFGDDDFSKGLWEIGYNVTTSLNLTQVFDKFTKVGNVTMDNDSIKIEPQGQYGYLENQIPNAKGGDIYRVSFEVLPQNTSGFYFQLAQDIDNINDSGQKINQVNEFIDLTSSGNTFQGFQFTLQPLKPSTQQAAIRFVVVLNGQIPTPAILIKNLKIEKVLNADFVLRKVQDNTNVEEESGQILNIDQKNPILYKGRMEVKKPGFLIFSEAYHPGWKLILTDGKNTYYPEKHVMANLYGNGWFIEKAGNYDYTLEFKPQRIVNYGMLVAVISYGGLLIFILWSKFKHES